jgi:hypothetical protein
MPTPALESHAYLEHQKQYVHRMRETEKKRKCLHPCSHADGQAAPFRHRQGAEHPPFALWDSTKPALSTDAEASTQAETLVRTARRASKRRCGELCERLVSDRRDRLWRLGDANTPYVPTAQQASTMNHQRTRLNLLAAYDPCRCSLLRCAAPLSMGRS